MPNAMAALPNICGIEQRAPHIFGRAAIALGIGQHSSSSSRSSTSCTSIFRTTFNHTQSVTLSIQKRLFMRSGRELNLLIVYTVAVTYKFHFESELELELGRF